VIEDALRILADPFGALELQRRNPDDRVGSTRLVEVGPDLAFRDVAFGVGECRRRRTPSGQRVIEGEPPHLIQLAAVHDR